MAKGLKIYIDEEELDLFDNTAVPIQYSITDSTSIDTRSNSTSKTIRIPASKRNRIALDFPENVNSINAYDQTQKKTGRIIYGGTVLIEGFLKIEQPTIDAKGNVITYSFVLEGDNGDWRNRAKGKSIKDLDYSDQTHVYNASNILTSETVDPSREYVYPLANYGRFKASRLTLRAVKVEDRYPSWEIKGIVERILKENGGYTLADNGFFDTDFGSKLYLPFVNDKFSQPESFRDDRLFRANTSLAGTVVSKGMGFGGLKLFDIDSGGDYFDNGNDFDTTTFVYTAPVAGMYSFSVDLVFKQRKDLLIPFLENLVTTKSLGARIYIKILKNDSDVLVSRFFKAPNSFANHSLASETINLVAGDKFEVFITQFQTNFFGGFYIPIEFDTSGHQFSNDISLTVVDGQTIANPASNLPDIKQLDFLKGIRDIPNLMFLTNTHSRKVYIESYDDFYGGTTLDVSDLVDYRKDITIGFLGANLNKEVQYKYIDDSNDRVVEQLEKESDSPLGAHDVTVANQFAIEGKGLKQNEVFANTFMDTALEAGLPSSKIPKLWAELRNPGDTVNDQTAFVPRVWYYNGIQSTQQGEFYEFNGVLQSTFPNFYTVDESTNNTNSLQYGDTERTSGLFERFYRNTHNNIDLGRTVSLFLNLTPLHIEQLMFPDDTPNGFDYRTELIIQSALRPEINGKYRIQKIDNYDPQQNKTTKVVLLKVAAAIPEATKTLLVVKRPPISFNPRLLDVINGGGGTDDSDDAVGGDGLTPIDSTFVGKRLVGAGARSQVIVGDGNVRSSDDRMILGKTITETDPIKAGEVMNLFSVDKDGHSRTAGGGIFTTIGGVSQPVTYTYSGPSLAVTVPRTEFVLMNNNPK